MKLLKKSEINVLGHSKAHTQLWQQHQDCQIRTTIENQPKPH